MSVHGDDYCPKCGCPKEICCGQGKVSLEWLKRYWKQVGWSKGCLKYLLLAAKKQAGEK